MPSFKSQCSKSRLWVKKTRSNNCFLYIQLRGVCVSVLKKIRSTLSLIRPWRGTIMNILVSSSTFPLVTETLHGDVRLTPPSMIQQGQGSVQLIWSCLAIVTFYQIKKWDFCAKKLAFNTYRNMFWADWVIILCFDAQLKAFLHISLFMFSWQVGF